MPDLDWVVAGALVAAVVITGYCVYVVFFWKPN